LKYDCKALLRSLFGSLSVAMTIKISRKRLSAALPLRETRNVTVETRINWQSFTLPFIAPVHLALKAKMPFVLLAMEDKRLQLLGRSSIVDFRD
jgi:hypothetical protein